MHLLLRYDGDAMLFLKIVGIFGERCVEIKRSDELSFASDEDGSDNSGDKFEEVCARVNSEVLYLGKGAPMPGPPWSRPSRLRHSELGSCGRPSRRWRCSRIPQHFLFCKMYSDCCRPCESKKNSSLFCCTLPCGGVLIYVPRWCRAPTAIYIFPLFCKVYGPFREPPCFTLIGPNPRARYDRHKALQGGKRSGSMALLNSP